MHRQSLIWIVALASLSAMAAGCGSHVSKTAAGHHVTHHHQAPTSPSSSTSPSPTPTATPSSSPTTSNHATTSVAVQQNPNPSPVVSNQPTGGGVGTTAGLRITVQSVQPHGIVNVNGQTDAVYDINLSLHNITTSMIQFALSDIVVAPSGTKPALSRNDYDLSGISSQNSLFPAPIVPNHAQAVVRLIPSNQTVSGMFSVEVPQASHYTIEVTGFSSPIATFSS